MNKQRCPDCGCTHTVLIIPGLALPDPSDLCPDCQDAARARPQTAQEALAAAFRRLMTAVYTSDESDGTSR